MIRLDDRDELAAVEARFRALVAEWDVGRSRVAAMLGVDVCSLGPDLTPNRRDEAAEARLRMLLEISDMLPALVRDARDVPLLLRDAGSAGFVDEQGEPIGSLLDFLSGPIANVRAVRRALASGAGRNSRRH